MKLYLNPLLVIVLVGGEVMSTRYKVLFHSDIGGRSHAKPMLEIGQELIKQNHDFIYVSPEHNRKFVDEYPTIPFISMGDGFKLELPKPPPRTNTSGVERQHKDTIVQIGTMFPRMIEAVYGVNYPTLDRIVKEERPDAIICDFFNPYCRDIAMLNQVPLITGLQSTDAFGIMPSPFVTQTMLYTPITTDGMGLWDRVYHKVFMPLKVMYYTWPVIKHTNLAREKFGVPNHFHLFGDFRNSLAIANTFIGFEPATSVPPHIKMVGPIASPNYSKLTVDLEKFLEEHRRVVYIAFGSNAMLDAYDIELLVTTAVISLERGDIDGVVWGLGRTKPEDFPETIMVGDKIINTGPLLNHQNPHFRILNWAPQVAILEHPNTKLFVSHGGLESSFEGILSKTPILCMAMMAEQPRNARKLEDAGIGRYIDRITISPNEFSEHIAEFMQDSSGSIRQNLNRMHVLATTQENAIATPAKIIIDHVKLAKVCRPNHPPVAFGDLPCEMAHLASVGDKLGYIKKNQVDIYGLVVLFIGSLLLSLAYVGYRVSKFVARKKYDSNHHKKLTKRD